MILPVSDFASNAPEQLEHYAKLLQHSDDRQRLFAEVYRGPKPVKTVPELATKLDVTTKRILEIAKPLTSNHLFDPIKVDKRIAFRKISTIAAHKNKILALARDRKKLAALPTKRRPRFVEKLTIVNVGHAPMPRLITIDDVQEFVSVRRVKKVPDRLTPARLGEATVKKGIAELLGELKPPKDWGGEQNDLFSTNAHVGSRRRAVAFAFKGPATTGKLVPGKMGKNGDQLQRLVESFSAEVFLVQYEGEIDPRVLDQLKALAVAKAVLTGSWIRYGVIDRRDTYRLRIAYPKAFT